MASYDDMTEPTRDRGSGTGEVDASGVDVELVASARVAIVSGKNAGRVVPLFGREILIGRGPSAQIRIDEAAISARHAKIIYDGHAHSLVDLGSTNGTFLNGQQLMANQAVELAPNDSIQVAETVLTFQPMGDHDTADQTRYLSKVVPQIPGALALSRVPETQLLAQLLQATALPAAEEPKGPSLDEQIDKLLKVWRVVKRHWVPVFACAALFALLGDASVFVRPPPSEATVRMRISPPTSDQPDADRENVGFFSASEQDFVSPNLVKQTLVDLGQKNATREDAVRTLNNLKFEGVAHHTYQATYWDRDPKRAVNFLAQHVRNYFASEIQKTLHVAQTEEEFLEARVKEREDELRRTETELKDFKNQHLEGLPEYLGEHMTSREQLLTRKTQLSAELSRHSLELSLARKRLKQEAPLLSSKVERARPYEQALVEVNRKIAEATARGLADTNPEVVSLQKQASDLKQLAERERNSDSSEIERNSNPGLIELQRRVGDEQVAVKAASAELGDIEAQLKRLDKLVGQSPEVEARYAQLTRSYQVSKDMHARLFEQLRASQLKLELEQTSARARYEITSPPESGGVPVRKALIQRTIIGLVLGLMIGAAIAAYRELKAYLKTRKGRTRAIVPVPADGE